jgi:transposase InsO family protein
MKKIGISSSRYYDWLKRVGKPNQHNGIIPKQHWILAEEREAIINYCRDRLLDGYRRLSYMMLDEDIVAVSPSTTYRVLHAAGLLNRWSPHKKLNKKGFTQPERPHDHWHIDISYINILGLIYFLITVLDGASRYVLHHEVRIQMTEYDVEITIQKAREKFPEATPRIISDNGPQFISKDFKDYIRFSGFSHVLTSPYHPQSNGKLERFHGTIKQEEIRKNSYLNIEDARAKISAYIDYYNKIRLHSAIYYLTPEDILLGRETERLETRQRKLDQAREQRIKIYQETCVR